MSDDYCDVCLFTSVLDEFNAARQVFERLAGVTFVSSFTNLGREVVVAKLQNLAGEALTVQISCLPEMGGTNATSHILPIVQQYLPRFVGMTGICAGDRDKVMLGDLIVAVRAYEYEAGKVVLVDGNRSSFTT
jgi:nucleoside phosphorylase